MPDTFERLRVELGDAVRRLVAGPDAPRAGAVPPRADDGWFGPGSATWVVHSDLAMFVGGVRALLLQTLHPGAMAGVADHSAYREDPLGRLHRTGAFVGATTFGTAAEAEAAVATVRAVHRRVAGTTPQGRPYSAQDPDLVRWVHVTEVDSFLRAHRRYAARPLARWREDEYVAEMAVIGERLGGEGIPTTVAELDAAIEHFRPELAVGAQAAEAVRFLLVPPTGLVTLPPYAVIASAAITLLPAWARRMLWLPVVPLAEPLVVRPAATALLRTLGWALGPHPSSSTESIRS